MSDANCLSWCHGCRGFCKLVLQLQGGPVIQRSQSPQEEVPFPLGKHPDPPKEGETSGVDPINLGSNSNVDDDVSEDDADLGTPGQFSEYNSTMHKKV